MWLLCGHMVKQIWKKGGKWLLSIPLVVALLSILWRGSRSIYAQRAGGFLPYQDMVDYSLTPLLFWVGLFGLLGVVFLHYRQYHTKSNGMITFLTLPLSSKEIMLGLVLPAVIWIFLYYAVWFVALIVWYVPATKFAAHVAMQQEFWIDGKEIIAGVDPQIHNGLYLAFRRGIFLSNLFALQDMFVLGDTLLLRMFCLSSMAVCTVSVGIMPKKQWFWLICLYPLSVINMLFPSILELFFFLYITIKVMTDFYEYIKYPKG